MSIRTIGILQGVHRTAIGPSVLETAKMLRCAGITVWSDLDEISDNNSMPRDEVIARSDVLIACGGDGSILNVARCAAQYNVPVLGANFGQLGFLSEVGADELLEAGKRLLKGEYTIEKRQMLSAKWKNEEVLALNDIVVRKESAMDVVRCDVRVDGMMLDHYVADGILVSTPTGASAYALSCGGPVVHPKLSCTLVTAICPHSLRARPVMLAPEQRIEVNVAQRCLPAIICADGMDRIEMTDETPVVIEKAEVQAQFVRLDKKDFFSMVHCKLVDRT